MNVPSLRIRSRSVAGIVIAAEASPSSRGRASSSRAPATLPPSRATAASDARLRRRPVRTTRARSCAPTSRPTTRTAAAAGNRAGRASCAAAAFARGLARPARRPAPRAASISRRTRRTAAPARPSARRAKSARTASARRAATRGSSCATTPASPMAMARKCGLCAGNTTCMAGFKCTLGFCAPTASTASCSSVCSGKCVDPLTDVKNCGSCGHVCPGDGQCVNGVCNSCTAGFEFCDGGCVNVTDNAENCGGCGMACGAGSYCLGELKGCEACPGMAFNTTMVCNNACVYVKTDPTNCGGCGIRCKASCVGGTCQP